MGHPIQVLGQLVTVLMKYSIMSLGYLNSKLVEILQLSFILIEVPLQWLFHFLFRFVDLGLWFPFLLDK